LTSFTQTAVSAFFDVDNTLVPGRPIELRFFRHLWGCRQIGLAEVFKSAMLVLKGIPRLSLHPLRERKMYLENKSHETIEAIADRFVREWICPRLSQIARQAIDRHRDAGHELVLVTASPDFLITPLADHLKIATVLAATLERRGDCFTGRVLSPLPYGGGKRMLIERFAQQRGMDLRYSYAYGDSPGDLDALRSVGYPRVINPIRGMRRVAAREGWPVEQWT
jgi:HAD superfamily hydrolase (TIGR01490 family)